MNILKLNLSLCIIVMTASLNYTNNQLDTISIKGSLQFDQQTITGDFLYTLRNNSEQPQNTWISIIHPSVNILSIAQNNKQARIKIQHRSKYRILSIELPDTLTPKERSSLMIRFTINEEQNDPRFTVSSNFVFLDNRNFWFPFPHKNTQLPYEITVNTPNKLQSIMGGKIITEAVIINNRITVWSNELTTLSPSGTLIISDKKREKRDFVNIYTDNPKIADLIHQEITPYWNKIKNDSTYFELSEIHILPIELSIPQKTDNFADGEFLGNLFLIDNTLVNNALLNPQESFFLSGQAGNRLKETIIHELYHIYFPGTIKHDYRDRLFMESLVQYLTWNIIYSIEPEWGKKIKNRTRFLLQNIIMMNKTDSEIWHFLFDTTLLYNILSKPSFEKFNLIDTLIEKYRFIEFTKQDVLETIAQYRPEQRQAEKQQLKDRTQFFQENSSFNSTLIVEKKKFNISITNHNKFNKKKINEIAVETIFIDIEHNLPTTWTGNVVWIFENNKTNYASISIPKDSSWETNLINSNIKIKEIYTCSAWDILETELSDNIFAPNDIGIKITESINQNINTPNIIIENQVLEKLKSWKENNFTLKWDHTIKNQKNFDINIFLLDKNKKKIKFITLSGTEQSNIYTITNIEDIIQKQ